MNASNTWASVALTQPARPQPAEPTPVLAAAEKCAIVDASALIGGTIPRKLADNLVTTAEVLQEIKDKQSRQTLDTLPYGIAVQEPKETSVEAVTKFARVTGDIHALSAADVRLIALAHSLHSALYGGDRLHTEPQPPRVVGKAKRGGRQLPGWGAKGGTWRDLDQMDEAKLDAVAQGGEAESRVAAQVQNLSLNKSEPSQPRTPEQHPGRHLSQEDLPPSPGNVVAGQNGAENSNGEEAENDEDSEWEVAAKTKNKARKQRRKIAKRTAREEMASHQRVPCNQRSSDVPTPEAAPEPIQSLAATPDAVQNGSQGAESADDESAQSEADSASEASSSDLDDMLDEAGDEALSQQGGDTALSQQCGEEALSQQGGKEGEPSARSVVILTGDFAMQNVILQMGLNLISPEGFRIRRIRRWVFRCSACFKVTKEMERIFCPTCGNAALERVEMVVGANGTEQYGVKKKHNIRGTKFTLPKPRGGKKSKDPILREDTLLQRMPKKKPKETGTNPFVPEYNTATWHDLRGSGPSAYYKGIAAALPSWKNNPNERRHMRSNRRK